MASLPPGWSVEDAPDEPEGLPPGWTVDGEARRRPMTLDDVRGSVGRARLRSARGSGVGEDVAAPDETLAQDRVPARGRRYEAPNLSPGEAEAAIHESYRRTDEITGQMGRQPGETEAEAAARQADPTGWRRDRENLAHEARMGQVPMAGSGRTEDEIGDVGVRFLQNLDDRAGRVLGGILQSLPSIARQNNLGQQINHRAMTSMLEAEGLTPDQARAALDGQIAEWIRGQGRGIFDRATAELERNDPAASGALRFSYDVLNAFADLGLAVSASIATRSPTVGAAITGTQVFGDRYGESIAAGRSSEQAFADAAFYGMAEFIPERIAIGRIMRPGGTLRGRVATGAVSEGLQEALTETLQTAYDAGIIGEQMTWAEARDRIRYSGLVGAVAGGGVAAVSHPFSRDSAPGVGEAAAAGTVPLSEDDLASPLPTELIGAGRAEMEAALGSSTADSMLGEAGMPRRGTRVEVVQGGQARTGTLADAFEVEVPEIGTARGVRVDYDDGGSFEELFDTIRETGTQIRPAPGLPAGDLADPEIARMEAMERPAMPAPQPATAPIIPDNIPPVAPAAQPVSGGSFDIERYMVATRGAESAGDDNADNPRSSASGRYQFIDRTFNAYFGRIYGRAATPAERNNPQVQERLMRAFTQDNITALSRAGIGISNGTVYAAHHFGSAGAIAMARNPNGALPADVVRANPHLEGMTNGQALAWAERHVGGRGGGDATAQHDWSPTTAATPAIDFADPESAALPELIPIPQQAPAESGADRSDSQIATDQATDNNRLSDGAAPPAASVSLATAVAGDLINEDGATFVRGGFASPALADTWARSNQVQASSVTGYDEGGRTLYAVIEESAYRGGDGSRAAPVEINTAADIDTAAAQVAEPTEAQKDAGNYRKGHVRWQGFDITIENPKGSERSGTDPNGQRWSVTMPAHYGYVKRTVGADDEHVDVYLGDAVEATTAYVIDQNDAETGRFDEHKVMLGYASEEAARAAYVAGFSDGRGAARMGSVTAMPLEQFRAWLATEPRKPAGTSKLDQLRDQVAENREEHPGLVIKSLETGKETTIQPPGTRAPEARNRDESVPSRPTLDEVRTKVRRTKGKKPPSEEEQESLRRQEAAMAERRDENERKRVEFAKQDFRDPATALPAAGGDRSIALEQFRVDHDPDAMRAMLENEGIAMLPSQVVYWVRQQGEDWLILLDATFSNGPERRLTYGEGFGWSREQAIDKAVEHHFGREPALHLIVPKKPGKQGFISDHAVDLRILEDPEGRFTYRSDINFTNGGGTGPSTKSGERFATVAAARDHALDAIERDWSQHMDRRFSTDSERKGDSAIWKRVQEFIARHRSARPTEPETSDGAPDAPPKSAGFPYGPARHLTAEERAALEAQEPSTPYRATHEGLLRTGAVSTMTANSEEGYLENVMKRRAAYGSNNRLVTVDRAEEVRQRLREKFNQINAGIDPELLALGTELAVFHIEAGARRFADFAKAVANDLGLTMAQLKPHLRAWYTGAQAMMEDSGEDVSDMDGPGAVRAALSMIEESDISGSEKTDGVRRPLPGSDAAPGTADVQSAAPERPVGGAPEGEGGRGGAPVRPADSGRGETAERGGEGSADQAAGGRAGSGDADRVPGGGRGGLAAGNFVIEPGTLGESRSPKVKANDNIAAIEIVRALQREQRRATLEEQQVLARYVGWGGLKNVFPDPATGDFGKGFEEVGRRLEVLLEPEDYETARRSIQYAHYTSETIVREMWRAAEWLGFTGGMVFEPGMGTGNFAGMMPEAVRGRVQYSGLEMDGITAAIAKALYPDWGVRQADYTALEMPRGAYDLVIGNPPFSETVVRADPAYRSQGFVLHDYFFAKSLDAVRPGGLLMFVTSAGTMNKLDTKAREYLADRAELVGAIRLPGNAFKNAGAEVTTDIVILRRLHLSEERGLGTKVIDRTWTETVTRQLPDKEGAEGPVAVSRYFTDHAEMVLGNEGRFDQLFPNRYAVRFDGGDFPAALRAAIDRLPAGVVTERHTASGEDGQSSSLDFESDEKKSGTFYLKDGALFQQQGAVGRPVPLRARGAKGGLSVKDQEMVRQLIPIRDKLREVFAHDLAGRAAEGDKARKELNRAYDAFARKNGPINKGVFTYRRPSRVQLESARRKAREEARARGFEWDDGSFDPEPLYDSGATLAQIAAARADAKEAYERAGLKWVEGTFDPEEVPDTVLEKRPNIDAFMEDPESYRLRSIEHYDDTTGEAKKGAVFFENVVSRQGVPKIEGPADALPYVLSLRGRVDIDEIAGLAGVSPADAITALTGQIYRNPAGGWETSAKYLSGNVRKKLAEAEAAAERDPSFRPNVEALRAAVPPDLGKGDVRATLGMNWIDQEVVEAFGRHLGLSALRVRYHAVLATWEVQGDRASAAAISTWGTDRRSGSELISDALNGKSPKIYDRYRDENGEHSVLNTQATQAAYDKLVEIKREFQDWIWSEEDRATRLLRIYNDTYNSLVAPAYDGSYLTTPGVSSLWKWREHQTRGVARIIQEGNTYLAHAVGAGKTSTMIGGSQEMKRLGLVNKPMFVVPNHMLVQFTKEFYELYPTARIMVADEDRNFITDKRKQFISDAATSDIDAIIIKHSAFGLIPLSEDFQQRHLAEQLDDLRDILAELPKSDPDTRITRRRVEQMVEQTEQRIRAVTTRKTDQTFSFEEMGVDFLFVDEAHLFRKLDFPTSRGEVKGIDPQGSMRSMDLYMKTRHLEQLRPGRSHVLASGTPITNTMAELYTVSRYLQPAALDERGLSRFDAWASAFGDTVTDLEPTAAGTYKPVTRFSQFVNVPELSAMVRQIMDVVTPAELERYVTRPKAKTEMVVVPMTEAQAAYQEVLARRMKLLEERKGPPKKGDDIILKVINDGRNMAIDMRLVRPDAAEERTKLMVAIDEVHRVWKETRDQPFYAITADGYSAEPAERGPATQMVFASRGVGADRDFNVHKFIVEELARRGVPRSEMVIFNAIKNDVAKQRIFNDMNSGKVRILLGSVDKMGTGVNAQRRLVANHNMDPEWLPSSDEQRNGRIIRQGNMNREVTVYNYSTKGTYDSAMWGMMARKAKFIEGFFRGDPSLRDMEDLGEASKYEQAKALTTKDPRILELTEAKQELEREIRRRTAHSSDIATSRREAAHARSYAERLTWSLEQERKDVAQAEEIAGDAFTATIGSETVTKRDAFQEALDKALEGDTVEGLRSIGRIAGFELAALAEQVYRYDGDTKFSAIESSPVLLLNGHSGRKREERRYKELSPTNTAVSVQAFLTKLPTIARDTEAEIGRLNQRAAEFEARAAGAGPYKGEAKIAELQEKVDSITAELEGEGKATEANVAGGSEVEGVADQPEAKESRLGGPVTSLSGSELGVAFAGPRDMPALRDAGASWYSSNLLGRTVTTADGRTVRFSGRGLRKVTSKGETLLKSIPAIRDILERGELIESRPGRGTGTKAMHLYAASIELAGEPLNLIVSVRETADGNLHYDLTRWWEEGADGAGSDPEGMTPKASVAPALDSAPDGNLNIAILAPDLNAAASGIAEALHARLAEAGIADRVRLQLVDLIAGRREVAGDYREGLIRVALASTQRPETSLHHEIVHALREMGAFNEMEWRALERAAAADTALLESVKKRYPDLDDDGLVEEAVADFYARWASGGAPQRGFVRTALERIRVILGALRAAITGQGFTTAEEVMEAIRSGSIGRRGGRPGGEATKQSIAPGAHVFDNPEVEKRYQDAAEGLGDGASLLMRVKLGLARLGDAFTRHWIDLPNKPVYAALQQKLRALEAAPQAAKERTVRLLSDITKDFSRADLDLFTRKVILDDLAWESDQDHELPFGLTRASHAAEKAKVDRLVDANARVATAIRRRKLVSRAVATELVDAGVLEAERLKNPAYFRHVVLQYARAEALAAKGVGRKLRSPRWAKRMGSSLDINANYLEAEFDWLQKAFTDIPVAKAISWIKESEHNILPRLREEAKASNKAGIAALVQRDKEEGIAGGMIAEQDQEFRRNIAMGFKFVQDALDGGLDIPPELEDSARAIGGGKGSPFPLLSWMLDNNTDGANGAAVVLKAISQRRTWTRQLLGKNYIDDMDADDLVRKLAPEGFTPWTPDEGRLLFTVKTLPEHALDRMIEKIDAAPGVNPTEMRAFLESTRQMLAMGGTRYQMILPNEVAMTLNQLRRDDLDGLFDMVAEVPLRAWKRWVLINPRRVLKYNINNLSGDLDAVIAGNPRMLRHVGRAGVELARVMRLKAAPSARYEEAVERGVFDSGLSVQEIPDINRLSAFEGLTQGTSWRPDKVAMRGLAKVWRTLQGTTQWRENVFRYAAYLDYVERIEGGETQASIGYGASLPAMVDAVPDPKDRAALLARDMIGDYGAISHAGGEIRRKLIPFWSWMEINTKRYWRLSANAFGQGIGKGFATTGFLGAAIGARTTVWLGVRMGLLYGAITLWNALLMGDLEDELSDEQRRQLHLILGRDADGRIVTLRVQGALSDALSWFGLGDAAEAVENYELGRGGIWNIVSAPARATINKIGTALSPLITVPLEAATGQKLWPDLFATRFIRDRWRNTMSTFSVEHEYDLLTGRPSRGYGASWVDGVVYRRDPGEIAYNDARGVAYDWLRRVKGQEVAAGASSFRADALYDWRASRRFGDVEAERRALDRMTELGMRQGDISRSVRRAHPLGPIARRDRRAFLDSLTDEELQTFERAERWYEQRFLVGPQ